MPVIETKGAASSGGFGQFARQVAANYIEDVFSTYLYRGNSATQTINNGINLGSFPVSGTFSSFDTATGTTSFTTQANDWLVVFAVGVGQVPAITINGTSVTASTTNTAWYNVSVFISQVSAGNTIITWSGVGASGHIDMAVISGPTSISVAQNLTNNAASSITTSSFSSAGFGLILISDRDEDATPACAGSTTYLSSSPTYFESRFFAVAGNGTTVPAQTVTGLAGASLYDQNWCVLKVEGAGANPTTNGIAAKGGMVWAKSRTLTASNVVGDTVRGVNKILQTNAVNAESSGADLYFTQFGSGGFTVGSSGSVNTANNYVSWTFRKQAKFFDVVTYTGDGNYSTDNPAPYGRAIAHSLGSRPGFIVIKPVSASGDWYVGARQNDTFWMGSLGTGSSAFSLNGTGGALQGFYDWATKPMADANSFFPARIGASGSSGTTNDNGVTYVAYLFAHDAGGFGVAGTDNVISCGSYTGNGGSLSVNLGYEAQWVLIKRADASGAWVIVDNMRAMSETSTLYLYPPYSFSEQNPGTSVVKATSTGFNLPISSLYNANGATYIYMAIRRGPMRTPTSGTSVFAPLVRTGTLGDPTAITGVGFPPDLAIPKRRDGDSWFWGDKLRGSNRIILSNLIQAESDIPSSILSFDQNGITVGNEYGVNYTTSIINYFFRRAPGFFDVVCYTGNGTTLTANHNLGVVPEMMIIKRRDTSGNWSVYTATTGVNKVIELNEAYGAQTASYWGTGPTATTFQVQSSVNTGNKFVAYLFASCPGVSKVGSYTGTGTTQQINCGFTGGARFVLIKRTDDNSSGTANWFVWDSARGIVSANDPYLLLNSSAAEVTSTDYIDTLSSGFEISSTAPAAINANGGSYIFLAIA